MPTPASVKWGHEARVGYFAQDHRELLTEPKQAALDVIWNTVPDAETSRVRGQLGRMLFSGRRRPQEGRVAFGR